ncbi:hypothetical protein C8T65DRAFT_736855 [Cerioporus squamosus]|nr:hypothetical protein C8T65DRAFT_736855 [Cerioporus squamosus]
MSTASPPLSSEVTLLQSGSHLGPALKAGIHLTKLANCLSIMFASEPDAESSPWIQCLTDLEDRYDDYTEEDRDEIDEQGIFVGILKDICQVVREAHEADAPDIGQLVDTADELLDKAVSFARELASSESSQWLLGSFAHAEDAPPIQDIMSGMWGIIWVFLHRGSRHDGEQELRYLVLHYYRLNEDAAPEYAEGVRIYSELSGTAFHLAMNEERKLMFIADDARIKSFSWEADIRIMAPEDSTGAAVHTMRCDRYEGAIEVLPNGRLVRAGRGQAAIWNLDELQTPWATADRTGSSTSKTEIYPCALHYHSGAETLLAAENRDRAKRHTCVSIDFEHGGRVATRYLGHARTVYKFSSSPGDANAFATASLDGHARIYDVRSPLPAITIEAVKKGEACPDVVLTHPDGIPTLGPPGPCRLSTGNNCVQALAWDSKRSTLYAATDRDFQEYLRLRPVYRKARIPQWAKRNPAVLDGARHLWPRPAWYREDYYGYAYDAPGHSLLKYQFKETPDTTALPTYKSRMRRNSWDDDY